jgi:hypothetical protein
MGGWWVLALRTYVRVRIPQKLLFLPCCTPHDCCHVSGFQISSGTTYCLRSSCSTSICFSRKFGGRENRHHNASALFPPPLCLRQPTTTRINSVNSQGLSLAIISFDRTVANLLSKKVQKLHHRANMLQSSLCEPIDCTKERVKMKVCLCYYIL